MALPAMKKTQSTDRVINAIQDNVETALRPILKNPLLDGRLIEGIDITVGEACTVEHGLGRNLRGWFVVSPNASSNVWETASALPTKTLILNASANVRISVWIF